MLPLYVIVALSSFILVSSASFEQRFGNNTRASNFSDKRRKPQPPALQAQVNQENTTQEAAVRIDIPAVKPKAFHGDVRRLPLVRPKVKKPLREPKEPGPDLPSTTAPDTAFQVLAPAAPAPAPSTNFLGLDFANWGAGWPPDTN
ncbi:MAG TPA: hypothetical protein VM656_15425, partial [Pyrinomonadaceae bacterium]|nr:hypothetical protein [Pyrinomonadaceae bacterium]